MVGCTLTVMDDSDSIHRSVDCTMDIREGRRMTAEERADVLNAIQEAIEKYGLIVTGYDDCCNVFEVVMMAAERKEE